MTRAERLRKTLRDPKVEARRRAAAAAGTRTPDARERRRRSARAQWDDPEAKAKLLAAMADPASREKCRVAAFARHGDFWCPPELLKSYRKIRRLLGVEAARDAIRAELLRAFLRGAP